MDFPSLIPPGFTNIEPGELEPLFVEPFAEPSVRRRLTLRFLELLEFLRGLELRCEIWVDGSFTTGKPQPSDIDILILCGKADLHSLSEDSFERLERMTKQREETKIRYRCDVYICDEENEGRVSYWRGWFGYSKNGTPKGIACLRLGR